MSQYNPHAQPSHERLAFSFHATVPARRAAAVEPTFATAAISEPRDWGYTGLLAFTFVLLFRPQDDLAFLRPLRIAEVCALIGIMPMILHRLGHRLPVFRVTREMLGLCVFGAVMLATVPFSIWPGGALNTALETFFKVLVVFALMMNTLTTPKRIEQITWLILLAGGYVAARGVLDYARGVNLVEGGRLAGAVSGIFGNPNDLALNMVCMLPLAALAALSRRYTFFWRAIAAVAAVLMIATVLFTKSRGGALGLGVVIVALLFTSRAVRPGIAIALLSSTLVATPFLPTTFWDRMSTIFNAEQDQRFTGSREERATLLLEGVQTFLRFPLTGVGAGQFKNYDWPERQIRWREAHNAVIQVAADLGIFGVAALLYLMYRGVSSAWVLRRQLGPQRRRAPASAEIAALTPDERGVMHSHAVAMLAALIGWCFCAMFASVAYSWTFYYLLALTVAARELIRDRIALGTAPANERSGTRSRHTLRTRAETVTA
jgi:O-antigen ligase